MQKLWSESPKSLSVLQVVCNTKRGIYGGGRMKPLKLAEGRCVEFHYHGFRLGRIVRIKGNRLTVVLSPFLLRGKRKGKKIRIEKSAVIGIVRGKEVIKCHI